MKNVLLYTTPSCGWCRSVKNYLIAHRIKFTEIDVYSNPQASMEMVYKSGQRGVPVLDIDGNIVVGFDRRSIDGLLGL